MKKQLLLLTTLFSIGSLYAMDSHPNGDSPTNPIVLSDASKLAAEGTPEGDASLALLLATQNSLNGFRNHRPVVLQIRPDHIRIQNQFVQSF